MYAVTHFLMQLRRYPTDLRGRGKSTIILHLLTVTEDSMSNA